ncbi:MAG TPA: hypothetical protein VF236_00940 [Gaiellaceae bacterium]
MPTYLVESYAPRSGAALDEAIARVRRAAKELAAEGMGLRHVRSTFVPEDEICFHAFEAESPALVTEVGRRAGLPFEHVVEAMPVTPHGSTSPSREEAS